MFRRLFLGLGVALGLASGQPDPSIFASVAPADDGRGGVALVVYARVEEAFAPGALELVETGTRVALRYSARLEGQGGRSFEAGETRAIWYDLRSARYGVSFDGGRTSELVDPQAARTLVSELRGLELCRADEATGGERVVVQAEIGIMDAHGDWHDAPVLWNYISPRVVLVIGEKAGSAGAGPAGGR
jgi:hypothetical protein